MMNVSCRIGILLVIPALLFSGCKDHSTNNGPADPYSRWKTDNIHNYTVDQIRSCFCPYGSEKMRLTVRSDTVVRVVRLSDGSVLAQPAAQLYLTVDSLFGIIRNHGNDSLVIEYDPQYGYPSRLDVNPQLHPVDGGVLIESSNLLIQ